MTYNQRESTLKLTVNVPPLYSVAFEDVLATHVGFLSSVLSPQGRGETRSIKVLFLTITSMGILSWIVFGAIVGWIASALAGTNNQQGAMMNIVVGIVGAVIGGWIMSYIGQTPVTGFNLYSLLVAVFGAVVLIGIVKTIRKLA